MRFSHTCFAALAVALAGPAFADPAPSPSGPAGVTAADDAPALASDAQTDPGTPATDTPAADAEAAPPKAFTISGGVTLVSDYRFRGLTQTDEKPALQATINLNHSSGFYIGTWTSTIDGGIDGSTPALTGYGSAEVDLYGGFTRTLKGGFGFDVGLLYYLYPDRVSGLNTDFFEPYASINYTIGPVNAKVGGAYAWGGQKGLDFTTGDDDSLYLYGELSGSIPRTPVTLRAHLGHSGGSLGLVNPGIADNDYWDWSLTAEAVIKTHFKIGVTYLDTDISNDRFGASRGFAQGLGRGATGLVYVGVSF